MVEIGVPGENHRSAASHRQTLSHNVVSGTPSHEQDSKSQLYIVVTGTNCIGSCKSNYHTISKKIVSLGNIKKNIDPFLIIDLMELMFLVSTACALPKSLFSRSFEQCDTVSRSFISEKARFIAC